MFHCTASHDQALLEDLLRMPVHSPQPALWAAPVRLRPRARPARSQSAAMILTTRPLMVAGTLLLTAGIVAGSLGAGSVRAAQTNPPASLAPHAVLAPASEAHAYARIAPTEIARAVSARIQAEADAALLAHLLATVPSETAAAPATAPASPRLVTARAEADAALLASLLASEPSALAMGNAASTPATAVSFATVNALPASAQVYRLAPLSLPALTLAQQTPPPPGYQQPPGYMDGVPFGGQIGAVPGSPAATRPPGSTTRPPTTTRPSVPATYAVQPGDTLTSIALRFYGDASVAPLIWETNFRVIGNDPNRIIPGQRLTLPVVPGRPILRPTGLLPQGPIARPGQYTIQPRDFLRWMAQRAYGNEMRWREIYNANRNVLGPNPDLIFPGVRVFVP